jgi:hypothetical protein
VLSSFNREEAVVESFFSSEEEDELLHETKKKGKAIAKKIKNLVLMLLVLGDKIESKFIA